MPYKSTKDIDQSKRKGMTSHGSEIYKNAFNSALDQYGDEATAHKVANAAVTKSGERKESRFSRVVEDSRPGNAMPSCWIDPNGGIIEVDHRTEDHDSIAYELYGVDSDELIREGFIKVTTLLPVTHFVLPSWNEQHKRRASKFIENYDWLSDRKISISTLTSSHVDTISGDWESVFDQLSEGKLRESSISDRPVYKKLMNLRRDFAIAAQSVYDYWEQEDGYSDELGTGGICDQIVESWYEIMDANFDEEEVEFQQGGQDGDDHAWLVVRVQDNYKFGKSEIYGVDINPFVYETGGGYHWEKKPNVKFQISDVEIFKV